MNSADKVTILILIASIISAGSAYFPGREVIGLWRARRRKRARAFAGIAALAGPATAFLFILFLK